MNPATRRLHEAMIRLVKGIVTAWETWLREVSIHPPSGSDKPVNAPPNKQ